MVPCNILISNKIIPGGKSKKKGLLPRCFCCFIQLSNTETKAAEFLNDPTEFMLLKNAL